MLLIHVCIDIYYSIYMVLFIYMLWSLDISMKEDDILSTYESYPTRFSISFFPFFLPSSRFCLVLLKFARMMTPGRFIAMIMTFAISVTMVMLLLRKLTFVCSSLPSFSCATFSLVFKQNSHQLIAPSAMFVA